MDGSNVDYICILLLESKCMIRRQLYSLERSRFLALIIET